MNKTKPIRARRTPKVNRADSPTASTNKPCAATVSPSLHRYSREGGDWFWTRVRHIHDPAAMKHVYVMGCALQDLESRVLHALESAERGDW